MANEGIGTGTSIKFGAASYPYRITNLKMTGISREAYDTTHMSQVNAGGGTPPGEGDAARTFVPGGIVDGGQVVLECLYNPDDASKISSAAEAIVITFPDASTASFSGAVVADEPNMPSRGVMTQTVTVAVLGPITIA